MNSKLRILICMLLAFVAAEIGVMPLSHHIKATRHDRQLYQIHDGGSVDWYQRGMPPDWAGLPHALYDERWKDPSSTILIQIAALRETRCGDTLWHFLTKAKYPERVFFVVIQQNKPEDTDCMEQMCKKFGHTITKNAYGEFEAGDCPYFNQVTMRRLTAKQAKGPMYARGLANEYVDEDKHDFCLQIDAHELGNEHWDVEILKAWASIDNEFAVISTYPTAPDHLQDTDGLGPHLCKVDIWRDGVRNSQARTIANHNRPVLAPLWAAGLSFSRCHADSRVPTDPNMFHVFLGEEYSRGSRLWTNGYDFYSLHKPIIGAYYGDEKGNHLDWTKDPKEEKAGKARMKTLLRMPGGDHSPEATKALGKYSMGTRRRFEDYVKWSGVNTMDLTKPNGDQNCIVYYVPWDDTDIKRELTKQKTPQVNSDIKPVKMANRVSNVGVTMLSTVFYWAVGLLFVFIVLLFLAFHANKVEKKSK